MHDTTFYEAWGWLIFAIPFGVCLIVCVVFGVRWLFQYTIKKGELGTPGNYAFKDYLKWLFEGIGHDIWAFLRVILKVVLIIAAIVAGIALLYLLWSAIASGIDHMSVKGVLVIITVLLILILFKNTR